MTTTSRLSQVQEVERFLADDKTLSDRLPDWRDSHLVGRWSAEWPIIDSAGIALEGTRLVFVCKKDEPTRLSASVLFRGSRIFGVDLVPGSECKMNPPDGHKFSLPSRVCGSHFHEWADNREYALEAGLGSVPYRRPTPRLLTRLPHALAALAQAVNIILTPEQASFDVPAQGFLALGGDNDLR